MHSTEIPVNTAIGVERRPRRSESQPISGAARAISTAATTVPRESTCEVCSGLPKEAEVR